MVVVRVDRRRPKVEEGKGGREFLRRREEMGFARVFLRSTWSRGNGREVLKKSEKIERVTLKAIPAIDGR
jgi:hypothetical protein